MNATTCMRDSIVGDAWIKEMCQRNPVQYVIDEKTGQRNGNILSGPVRLAFPHLLKPAENLRKIMEYGAAILFTPFVDTTILWEEFNRIARGDFGNHWNGQSWSGLDIPFKDQADKAHTYKGYTPGLMYTNVKSQFRPGVVDIHNNAIVDEAKCHPGVWAICALSIYASGKTQIVKGPRFGLQGVMIVGDDTDLGSAGIDTKQTFAGVKVQPPAHGAAAAFGQGTAQPQGPQGVGVQGMYPPGQGFGGPAPQNPPGGALTGAAFDPSQFMR